MPNIVSFDDDDGGKMYCDQKNCGGLLIRLKNGDSACTLCEHAYSAILDIKTANR